MYKHTVKLTLVTKIYEGCQKTLIVDNPQGGYSDLFRYKGWADLFFFLSVCVCVCVCVWRGIQNLEFQYRFGVFIKNNYFRGYGNFMDNFGGHF